MRQKHIDNDTLGLYVKTISYKDDHCMESVQYHKVLDHLALCEECRDQVSIITSLQDNLSQIPHDSSLTDEQQQLICDYLDGQLDSDEAEQAKTLIENQSDAMRSALHYQSHVASMQPHLTKQYKSHDTTNNSISDPQLKLKTSTVSRYNPKTGYLSEAILHLNELFNIRSPLIYTMTATAAILLAVFSLLQSPDINLQRTKIASYQDNATIRFTDKNKLPGIGFFSQSGGITKPFDDIKVELIAENKVKISWPVIDDVELYKMRLQTFQQGKKITLKEASTIANHATFQLKNNHLENKQLTSTNESTPDQRYEWVLYGNTSDNQMFYAAGGFVVNYLEKDNN